MLKFKKNIKKSVLISNVLISSGAFQRLDTLPAAFWCV